MKKLNKNSQARGNGPESTAKTSLIDASNISKKLTKRQYVLRWLIEQSYAGRKVTRFDASKIGDTCLNTTVSEIGRYDGVVILRESTTRPTRFNRPVVCRQYWIPLDRIGGALMILTGQTGGAS